MIKPLISNLVSNQLPEYAQNEFPKFIAFLQAYYRFLEINDKRDFTDLRSIDTTLDSFIGTIKSELDTNGLTYGRTTEQALLKNIKQMYLAKGSEESYRLLFRLLFNKEINLYYPSDSILKPSDGKWEQDKSVLVQTRSGDVYSLVGQQIEIASNNKKILCFVEKVRVTNTANIYEVFIGKNFYGNIVAGSTILKGSYSGVIKPTLVSYTIFKGGQSFKLGQLFNINTTSGNGLKVKVKKIDANGAILALEILSFGYGYFDSIYQSLNPIVNVVTAYNPFSDKIAGIIDSGVVIKPDYVDTGYVDDTYVGTVLTEFYYDSSTSTGNSLDEAVIQFNLGALCLYPGHYNGNDGFLSDSIKIQDSYFYQAYSYVIQIDETLQNYKEIVKNYLHPAGLKMFGEYQVNNNFTIKTSLQFILNFFRISIDDLILTSDSMLFSTTKALDDSIASSDLLFNTFTKAMDDFATTSDNNALTTTKALDDAIASSDLLFNTFTKAMDDFATMTDTSVLSTTKALDDAIVSSDLLLNMFTKAMDDFATPADSNSLTTTKALDDAIVSSDFLTNLFTKYLDDLITTSDSTLFSTSKALDDAFTPLDLLNIMFTKYINDAVSPLDSGGYLYYNYYSDPTYGAPDYSTGATVF